jgi:hypothetical protein
MKKIDYELKIKTLESKVLDYIIKKQIDIGFAEKGSEKFITLASHLGAAEYILNLIREQK